MACNLYKSLSNKKNMQHFKIGNFTVPPPRRGVPYPSKRNQFYFACRLKFLERIFQSVVLVSPFFSNFSKILRLRLALFQKQHFFRLTLSLKSQIFDFFLLYLHCFLNFSKIRKFFRQYCNYLRKFSITFCQILNFIKNISICSFFSKF